MDETFVDLGSVTVPSGVLVLGMAGWIDHWPSTGVGLARRARAAAASGGKHLRELDCEAVAVPVAAHQPLSVRASTSASPFDGEPTIAVFEVNLGVPWEPLGPADVVRLGDLPIDRCGMVLGDAEALDGFVGLGGESTDGLADLAYWGKYGEEAHAMFGEIAGCRVLGFQWDQGDHSIRHRGERRFGQVYPVTMEPDGAGGTVLRWTIPPYDPNRE